MRLQHAHLHELEVLPLQHLQPSGQHFTSLFDIGVMALSLEGSAAVLGGVLVLVVELAVEEVAVGVALADVVLVVVVGVLVELAVGGAAVGVALVDVPVFVAFIIF